MDRLNGCLGAAVTHHSIAGFDRNKSIGGTDISCICGVNPYDSGYKVWQNKRGEGQPLEDNRFMEWGRRNEGAVIQKLSDEHPEFSQVWRPLVDYPGVMSKEGGGAHASPDGIALTDQGGVILEAKTADGWAKNQWGDSGSEVFPLHYRYQVQWYMYITGLQRAFLGVLIGGNDYREYAIKRNNDLIATMYHCADEFWKQVANDVPPIPTKPADMKDYLLDTRGSYTDEFVPASSDHDTKVKEIKRIGEETAKLEKKKLDLQNELKTFIKDKGVKGIQGDGWKASWSQSTSTKIPGRGPAYKNYSEELEAGWTDAALAPIREKYIETITSDRLTINHKKGGKK